MCPDECPGLSDVYGDEFVKLYTDYENKNKGKKQVDARDLWYQILDSQMETGTPYILYKDACNKNLIKKILVLLNHLIYVRKSSNIATIKKLLSAI